MAALSVYADAEARLLARAAEPATTNTECLLLGVGNTIAAALIQSDRDIARLSASVPPGIDVVGLYCARGAAETRVAAIAAQSEAIQQRLVNGTFIVACPGDGGVQYALAKRTGGGVTLSDTAATAVRASPLSNYVVLRSQEMSTEDLPMIAALASGDVGFLLSSYGVCLTGDTDEQRTWDELMSGGGKKTAAASVDASISVDVLRCVSTTSATVPGPTVEFTTAAGQRSSTTTPLVFDAVVYVHREERIKDGCEALRRQLEWLAGQPRSADVGALQERLFHFRAPGVPFLVPAAYPVDTVGGADEDRLEARRRELHRQWLLPEDRPIFRIGRAVPRDAPGKAAATAGRAASSSVHLVNVHEGCGASGVQGGKQFLVQGTYGYYHYMQDDFDDKGWGCAYRSLQTLCSWLELQNYTTMPVPSHRDIQAALVAMGDKPSSFVGSKQWIGAIEVGMCLTRFYDVTYRILNVNSGADLATQGRALAHHFSTQGSPIMIGGGVLAYTLLGVDWNEQTGDIRYLILDPHYVGRDEPSAVRDKGWCAWKGADLFEKNAYYNLCMPQRPTLI